MTVSLYEGRRYDPSRFVRLMTTVNLAFSACVLFSWPIIGHYFSTAISAASEASLDPNETLSIASYPYVLLWLLPMLGAGGAWLAGGCGQQALARFLSAYPMLLIVSSCLWYWYLAGIYA